MLNQHQGERWEKGRNTPRQSLNLFNSSRRDKLLEQRQRAERTRRKEESSRRSSESVGRELGEISFPVPSFLSFHYLSYRVRSLVGPRLYLGSPRSISSDPDSGSFPSAVSFSSLCRSADPRF